MKTYKWPLENGEACNFYVYEYDTTWNEEAGLYIFAYQTQQSWTALYVGQTDNFSNRLPNHERWEEAVQLGATHVHTVVVSLQTDRDQLEKRLIQVLQPEMNEQLR